MYNYMQSKLYNGSPFIDPTTGLNVNVCLAGDPIRRRVGSMVKCAAPATAASS